MEKYLSLKNRLSEIKENKFHHSLIACCAEILFFIVNNTDISLPSLFEICVIDSYDFWTKIRFFIELDVFLPQTLKENFQNLERLIMFIYCWKAGSHISNKINSIASQSTSNFLENREIQEDFFFKRLLHLTAMQIQELAEVLNLDSQLAENSWKLMKEILSKETATLINKNVIQFILSSVYSVCKLLSKGNQVTFSQIIMKYDFFFFFNFFFISHQI